MSRARIGIVEDEVIVAEDISQMLQGLGYDVVGIAVSADEAVALAREQKPDLLLMDIRIQGSRDGISAAEDIVAEFNVPVIFVTAYADDATLERAKATLPYGYILKPFQEKDLSAAIKVALYRHLIEETLNGMEEWHSTTLRRLPWGVITSDHEGKINYVNPAGGALLQKHAYELLGTSLDAYFPPMSGAGHAIGSSAGRIQWVMSEVELKGPSAHQKGRLVVFHKKE